jgi:hypothetical protein
VKLPLLLTQYLREHQLLRLPGLGSFHSNGPQGGAEGETPSSLDVRFERINVKEADDELVNFIRERTGKIKPLAIADLSSYLESGLQLLNIGKPFYIEGIGTIQKTRDGSYDFVARELVINRGDEPTSIKGNDNSDKRKSVFDDEKYTPTTNPWQKIIVATLIIGGLAIVVLGGYYLYNQNNGEPRIQNTIVPAADSTDQQPKDTLNTTDTARSMATFASLNPGAYKFIIETTTNKKRAMRRYNQLIDFTNVKMETPDSTSFKLYFLISAAGKDTTRIKDSLSRFYASKVKIEGNW